ncbi:MAG TPA: transglycosylase SLT domain-containing protein [Opitutaceae bacterium]|nr:transglycosylase SLT domain-containing protein [Opitutaceae bacterium]
MATFAACSRPKQTATERIPRSEVWLALQTPTEHYRMDPAFAYALIAAESNFDARALNERASGLFQIKPEAWKTVSTLSYDENVFDWRTNLQVGVDYLAWCRHTLHQKNVFSYPLLLASFHYGLDYVEARGFKMSNIPIPDNEIYRQLFAGNLTPVPSPVGK